VTVACRLFQSFDYRHNDQMEWRSFLQLLNIMLQPWVRVPVSSVSVISGAACYTRAQLSWTDQLNWAFAMQASYGFLELATRRRLAFTHVKSMVLSPCSPSSAPEVEAMMDVAWTEFLVTDAEVLSDRVLQGNEVGSSGYSAVHRSFPQPSATRRHPSQ
jgi:hypothetical protein